MAECSTGFLVDVSSPAERVSSLPLNLAINSGSQTQVNGNDDDPFDLKALQNKLTHSSTDQPEQEEEKLGLQIEKVLDTIVKQGVFSESENASRSLNQGFIKTSSEIDPQNSCLSNSVDFSGQKNFFTFDGEPIDLICTSPTNEREDMDDVFMPLVERSEEIMKNQLFQEALVLADAFRSLAASSVSEVLSVSNRTEDEGDLKQTESFVSEAPDIQTKEKPDINEIKNIVSESSDIQPKESVKEEPPKLQSQPQKGGFTYVDSEHSSSGSSSSEKNEEEEKETFVSPPEIIVGQTAKSSDCLQLPKAQLLKYNKKSAPLKATVPLSKMVKDTKTSGESKETSCSGKETESSFLAVVRKEVPRQAKENTISPAISPCDTSMFKPLGRSKPVSFLFSTPKATSKGVIGRGFVTPHSGLPTPVSSCSSGSGSSLLQRSDSKSFTLPRQRSVRNVPVTTPSRYAQPLQKRSSSNSDVSAKGTKPVLSRSNTLSAIRVPDLREKSIPVRKWSVPSPKVLGENNSPVKSYLPKKGSISSSDFDAKKKVDGTPIKYSSGRSRQIPELLKKSSKKMNKENIPHYT